MWSCDQSLVTLVTPVWKKSKKELKVKVRKFLGLILTFAEVTREKQVGGGEGGLLFAPPPPLHPK